MSFLSEIQKFRSDALRATTTQVTLADGRQFEETRDKYGRIQRTLVATGSLGYLADVKPDLQVGVILPGLLLGSQDVAADLCILADHKVTHILNVASMVDNMYPDDFVYKSISILDLPETDITVHVAESIAFIEEGRRLGCVLVHCNAGVSRSASLVIAYLMTTQAMDFHKAFDLVKEKRPASRPNDGFRKQLMLYKPKGDG